MPFALRLVPIIHFLEQPMNTIIELMRGTSHMIQSDIDTKIYKNRGPRSIIPLLLFLQQQLEAERLKRNTVSLKMLGHGLDLFS